VAGSAGSGGGQDCSLIGAAFKVKVKIKIKGGGQECPPYSRAFRVAALQSAVRNTWLVPFPS